MKILQTLTAGLGKIAYEACEDGGKQNFGEWDDAPHVVRYVHDEMAEAVAVEVIRRLCGEKFVEGIYGADLSEDCMAMIHDAMVAMGCDLSATPPYNYPEAIQSLIFKRLKEVGAFGHPPTVRYNPSDLIQGGFERVDI